MPHAALAGVVGDFDRAAWHRAAATDMPDESVAALLDAAADRAIRRGALTVAVEALERAATLSADGRARGTRLLRAAEVANEIGRMDVIGQMLAEADPIDVPALEDRRQAWITALALSGPGLRARRPISGPSSPPPREPGKTARPTWVWRFSNSPRARSWWLDPASEIRSEIADAARAARPGPERRPRLPHELDRARGPHR